MNRVSYNPNLTFGSIPTTCFRSERPGFFHAGTKPKDVDNRIEYFMRSMTQTVRRDRFTIVADGRPVMVHPKWLRDHIHELKGFKHWEHDLKSYLTLMCRRQRADGQFYEMVQLPTNYHWTVVNDENRVRDEKNGLVFVRVELEADIEYLMAEGVWQVWQATGDRAWMESVLPALEKGMDYVTSAPKRWDEAHGLCKRPFTIDTWDFVFDNSDDKPADDRNIRAGRTPMSIMHGDNSGAYQAMRQLAALNRELGRHEKAADWEARAERIRENLNKWCWNGDFYTHQLHLGHEGSPSDGEESARLSLSNAYDINRGVTTFEQANRIIESYRRLGRESGCFAEWFTIYPPYRRFRGALHTAGHYVNGCIASLTAGELAKAALNNGCEAYGWDIFRRLMDLFEKDGELFFLYDPVTGENAGGGPSGWGAAALISAFEEGVAGIVDAGVKFSRMRFQPRWAVTGERFGKYITGYEVSDTFVESAFEIDGDEMRLRLVCPSESAACHVLLPEGRSAVRVICNDRALAFKNVRLNASRYADFEIDAAMAEKPGGAQNAFDMEIVFD